MIAASMRYGTGLAAGVDPADGRDDCRARGHALSEPVGGQRGPRRVGFAAAAAGNPGCRRARRSGLVGQHQTVRRREQPIAERLLPESPSCEERARTAAVIVAAWEARLGAGAPPMWPLPASATARFARQADGRGSTAARGDGQFGNAAGQVRRSWLRQQPCSHPSPPEESAPAALVEVEATRSGSRLPRQSVPLPSGSMARPSPRGAAPGAGWAARQSAVAHRVDDRRAPDARRGGLDRCLHPRGGAADDGGRRDLRSWSDSRIASRPPG